MCFTMGWLQSFLVNLIILGAVIAIIRILLPWALSFLGPEFSIVGQILNIVLWAIVAIYVIYICFALISCLGGVHGSFLPRL